MGSSPRPLILPLGDRGLLARFGTELTDAANQAALALAASLEKELPAGTLEVHANLISVFLRYDPLVISFAALSGEVRLALSRAHPGKLSAQRTYTVPVRFGGKGTDLEEVAARLGHGVEAFIAAHNAAPLRVLAMGFAPGFVYLGFHPDEMKVPRRMAVRPEVPAGTVLFAAGQTAIAATPIRTGWHVIGQTELRNFDARRHPPTLLRAGDEVRFVAAAS